LGGEKTSWDQGKDGEERKKPYHMYVGGGIRGRRAPHTNGGEGVVSLSSWEGETLSLLKSRSRAGQRQSSKGKEKKTDPRHREKAPREDLTWLLTQTERLASPRSAGGNRKAVPSGRIGLKA